MLFLKDNQIVLCVCAVMQSRDPSTNVVLLEDAAAVLGVILAAGCMGLTSLTGKHECHKPLVLLNVLHLLPPHLSPLSQLTQALFRQWELLRTEPLSPGAYMSA